MNFTLSDFYQMEVVRTDDIAEIIVDHFEGHPIRLIGFVAPADMPDIDVIESGYRHYNELFSIISDNGTSCNLL